MGRLISRGTRDAPRWYVDFYDVDGTRRTRLLRGIRKKTEAERMLSTIEARVTSGKPGMVADEEAPAGAAKVGPLMEKWRDSLTNRSAANDKARITKRLLPEFAALTVAKATTTKTVMEFLDHDGGSAHVKRHLLSLLSRFYGWLIQRGFSELNPVRMIPTGARPDPGFKKDAPWLRDEELTLRMMAGLPEPVGLMFYLGNRCGGMRLGEAAGLRMRDLDRLSEGVIVVGKSYGGCLKEDKRQVGKSKLAPAADDATEVLSPWLAKRRAAGAKPDDLVFPFVPTKPQNRRRGSAWTGYRKEHVEKCWETAARALGVELTWYQSTRHTWISRSLENGASLDEVSAAVGHSSPVVTRRWYDHFERQRFSAALRLPMSKKVTPPKPE